MPQTRHTADRTKVLSVRLTSEEFDALAARATEVGVGPSTLTRTLVRGGLALAGVDAPTASSTPPSPSRAIPRAAQEPPPSALEAQLLRHLAARVEELERWVAEH